MPVNERLQGNEEGGSRQKEGEWTVGLNLTGELRVFFFLTLFEVQFEAQRQG